MGSSPTSGTIENKGQIVFRFWPLFFFLALRDSVSGLYPVLLGFS